MTEPSGPDHPISFGWGRFWFAVLSNDGQRIASELRLQNIRLSNWAEGLKASLQDNWVFISPQVGGWSLVVGDSLPSPPRDECLGLLTDLSMVFKEAQCFGTEDVTELHSWARAENGRLRRAYAFSGEQGAVLWDRGPLTQEEGDLGLFFPEAGILSHSPDSASVFRIAGLWSLDPSRLDEFDCVRGVGQLGQVYQHVRLR
ncbi:MAG TPA: hypothetical protein VIW67_25725 [Terriglobales bacterium]|jgi:hypothetical protein